VAGRRAKGVIFLDRQWAQDNQEEVNIFRYPRRDFYQEYPIRIAHGLKMSFPTQASIKASIVALRLLEKRIIKTSQMFDEDSKAAERLLKLASRTSKVQSALMHRRRRRFDVDRGYAIRQKMEFLQDKAYAGVFRARTMVESLISGEVKIVDDGKNRWLTSEDKEEVIISYLVTGADEKDKQRIGVLFLDLAAPIPFCREVVEANLVDSLNSRKGKSFQFAKNKSLCLKVEKESKATIQDFVTTAFDRETHEMQNHLLLVDDISKEKEEIVLEQQEEEES